MDGMDIGQVLKVVGGIAIAVMVIRGCSSKEGRYTPPDPNDYTSMREFQRDRREYDKHYDEARRDYEAEHVLDPM